jgi:hypothetical protein
MPPLSIVSARRPRFGCGLSHSETLNFRRPPSTSFWTSHDAGATFVYQRQFVWSEWQSAHASLNTARAAGSDQRASRVGFGLACARP